jgi:hypothetical protein
MAQWIQLPTEPLFYQPDQIAFLDARRQRICRNCRIEYKSPPHAACPNCGKQGIRVFDRLTIMAGRRFGKSRIGSIAGAEEATVPNSVGWACAPTIPKLHRYIIPAFQQLIPNDWVENWNSEFKDLRLKNGALIHFQTLEDPDQGRGQGLDWLWIDEVCELTLSHWDVIRPSLVGNTVAFFTTTPRSYDWVWENLYKPAENGDKGYWACHARSADSANPRMNAEFLAREREQMSDAMYRQEYEADFVTFTGAIYGDLLLPQIIRSEDGLKKLLPEWPNIDPSRSAIIGIDTGADHPFGAVKLLATEQGFVAIDEYLERDKSFFQHVQSLKRMAGGNITKFAINRNERQPIIEFAQHGITCIRAENEQLAGVERVKTWLHRKQLWLYEPAVPNLVKQMKALRHADPRSDNQSTGVLRVFKKDDELPDCVRYALMTWPTLPTHKAEDTKRDLRQLPDSIRAAVERMRRIDEKERKTETSRDDFWL